jgi:hypothetical protein
MLTHNQPLYIVFLKKSKILSFYVAYKTDFMVKCAIGIREIKDLPMENNLATPTEQLLP